MLSRRVGASVLKVAGVRPVLSARCASATAIQLPAPVRCAPPVFSAARTMATQPHVKEKLPQADRAKTTERFREFSLAGKVFAVTGGARGLGLSLAEALVEAGGEVYCLDRLPKPDDEFKAAAARANPDFGGSLHYRRMDVTDDANVEAVMEEIANQKGRLDGLIAAAGINHVESAIDQSPKAVDDVIHINYTGVFRSAVGAAKAMMDRKCQGSILLVASMSGLVANKGISSAIYNSSKAAVIQLTRSLAMEWSEVGADGRGGIRVNCLCPGHIETPMVQMVIEKDPETRKLWESENMMKRLAKPEEFRGVALLLMSDASSFMTGSTVVVDGGHTAW